MNTDELVKQAKNFLKNEKGVHKLIDPSEIDYSQNIMGASNEELDVSIRRLDILVSSMWKLMKEKGYTDDDLMNQVTSIITENEGAVYSREAIHCPKCGQVIQEVKKSPLTVRCFYCGSQYVLYPYNDVEERDLKMIVEGDNDITPAKEEKAEEPPKDYTIPTEFEPYDVSKDLRFDEED